LEIPSDWKEFLQFLNSEQVEYLVIGAHALAFHGFPRTTFDFDVFVATGEEQAGRLMRALSQFGFGNAGLDRRTLLTPEKTLMLGVAPFRIDILTKISGVDFQTAWENRISGELDGVPTQFISAPDLLVNKSATGRSKDLADVDKLRQILGG